MVGVSGGVSAYVRLSERDEGALDNPRRLIAKAKLNEYTKILEAAHTVLASLNQVVTNVESAKARSEMAVESLSATIRALNGRNATLTEFVCLEKDKQKLSSNLNNLQRFQDAFVPQAADRVTLLGPEATPLTTQYINTLNALILKKRNLAKIVKYMGSCESLPTKIDLDEALASLNDDDCTSEIVSDSKGRILPFAAELEDLLEAALEKSFVAVQSFAQHVGSRSETIYFSQEAQNDEILAIAFDASEKSDSIPNRLEEQKEIIAFYQSVAILRMRPSYFAQCIKAVAILRGKQLTMTFLKDIAEGSPMIKGHKIIPRSLLAQAPETFATHFANVLALLLQLLREEVTFAARFWGYISDCSFPQDEKKLTNMHAFLEAVITHSVLREVHQILRVHIPFATRDIEGVPIDEHPRGQRGDLVGTFDLVYLLDLYSTLYSEVIQAAQVPTVVKYLIHLREGFYYTFQQQLETRALSLHENFMDETASPTSRTPSIVIEAVNLVHQLLKIFDQHILVMKKNVEKRPQDDMKVLEFSEILDAIFNPLINLLRHVSDKLPEDKAAILAVNSYSYMLASLASPPELAEWFPMHTLLTTLCDEAAKALAEQQVLQVLHRSGIESTVKFPEFDLSNVTRVTALYQVSSAISNRSALGLVMKVVSKTWRQRIKEDVLNRLSDEYDDVYGRVCGGEVENTLRSPAEFRALLVGAATALG